MRISFVGLVIWLLGGCGRWFLGVIYLSWNGALGFMVMGMGFSFLWCSWCLYRSCFSALWKKGAFIDKTKSVLWRKKGDLDQQAKKRI